MRLLTTLLTASALALVTRGGAPAAAADPPASPAAQDIAYAAGQIKPWFGGTCDEPRLDYPRWQGFPVALCPYSDIRVTVRTYMLNPDLQRQARWTATACADANASNMQACMDFVISETRTASSGGVFPVSGYIPEPSGGGLCYLFRDGVTVWTARYRQSAAPRNHSCGTPDGDEVPLTRAGAFARISSTTRKDYSLAGGRMPTADLQWVETTRKLYQEAWAQDRNELMSAVAKRGRRAKLF